MLLNFEVMVFAIKSEPERSAIALRELRPITPDLVESVEKMLLDDLKASRLINLEEYQQKPFWFKLSARVSNLLAPIL